MIKKEREIEAHCRWEMIKQHAKGLQYHLDEIVEMTGDGKGGPLHHLETRADYLNIEVQAFRIESVIEKGDPSRPRPVDGRERAVDIIIESLGESPTRESAAAGQMVIDWIEKSQAAPQKPEDRQGRDAPCQMRAKIKDGATIGVGNGVGIYRADPVVFECTLSSAEVEDGQASIHYHCIAPGFGNTRGSIGDYGSGPIIVNRKDLIEEVEKQEGAGHGK